MPNLQKPLSRTHQFTGEDEAHDLLVWMNCEQYPTGKWTKVGNIRPAFRRVLQILEYAKEVESSLRDGTAKAWGDRVHKLNHAIARYTFKPKFADPHAVPFLVWKRPKFENVMPSEHQTVLSLLRLLEMRLLYRVRECSWCTTWFFARFKHGKFCKTACQQKHYASSPDFKATKRIRMRDYRREQRRREKRLPSSLYFRD